MFFDTHDRKSLRLMRKELMRIEHKIDLLLNHAGLAYDPYVAVSESVAAALEAGRKIEAIKIYRAETGAGLREAKEYVESIAD
ncbi:MAG: ribosomal protein L7/L12 [Planctomycetota bacterium]|jgi:ribosomal protein L7/L12